MSNPPPPSIPGGTPPPPSIPTPQIPAAPKAPVPPPAAAAPAAPAPAAPAAAPAPSVPLRPAGLGGGIKLGGGLKTVALGTATAPKAPATPAPAAPAAAPTAPKAPTPAASATVPLKAPATGMATAQLPQATIGLNTRPTAAPVSSASFTAKKFEQHSVDEEPTPIKNVVAFIALAFALIFVSYQYATDTLDFRTEQGMIGGKPISEEQKPAPYIVPGAADDEESSVDAGSEEADSEDFEDEEF